MTTAETGGPNGLAPAWLLHRRAFRNTSLIVDLFLPNQGRVGAVARGGLCLGAEGDGAPKLPRDDGLVEGAGSDQRVVAEDELSLVVLGDGLFVPTAAQRVVTEGSGAVRRDAGLGASDDLTLDLVGEGVSGDSVGPTHEGLDLEHALASHLVSGIDLEGRCERDQRVFEFGVLHLGVALSDEPIGEDVALAGAALHALDVRILETRDLGDGDGNCLDHISDGDRSRGGLRCHLRLIQAEHAAGGEEEWEGEEELALQTHGQ